MILSTFDIGLLHQLSSKPMCWYQNKLNWVNLCYETYRGKSTISMHAAAQCIVSADGGMPKTWE
jgi:hypothetical protein